MNAGSSPQSDQYIDAIFGEGGFLAGALDGYRPRPGQIALARAVHKAIETRGHLLAEGPTGTGKSLAYAVPASYFAAERGRSVVIVTANIALQEQIVRKDLPLLASVAPWKFRFSLLKGRNNYLCMERFFSTEGQGSAKQTNLFATSNAASDADDKHHLDIVREWALDSVREDEAAMKEGRPSTATGDMTELPFEPSHAVWRNFSVSSDECRARCDYTKQCFANRALTNARSAHVIVTNYHMLYAHLAVYMNSGVDAVISPFEICILDEAHKAADIARDFFGERVTLETIKRVARTVRDYDPSLHSRIEAASIGTFEAMRSLRRDRERYKARLTGTQFNDFEMSKWVALDRALLDAIEILERRGGELKTKYEETQDRDTGKKLDEIEKSFKRATNARAVMKLAVEDPKSDHDRVYFLEEDDKQRVTIASKLVRASTALRPALFEKRTVNVHHEDQEQEDGSTKSVRVMTEGPPVAVIATSATLATDENDFSYAATEMGVPEGYDSLIAQTPFDFPKQCLFVVPEGMCEPNAEEFHDQVAKNVEKVVALVGGRTLALFTSRRSLEHTYDSLVGYCRRNHITLLKQGDEPRTRLIERFKKDIDSVLLGNDSFWAGVDVPGKACSAVVIDRLPFPTPDDPIMDRLAEDEEGVFWKHMLPRSIIAFKQGFGRLIRSVDDRGVVVCLDTRIVTKKYGRQFLRALPDVPKTRRIEAIAEWLNPPPAPAWDEK